MLVQKDLAAHVAHDRGKQGPEGFYHRGAGRGEQIADYMKQTRRARSRATTWRTYQTRLSRAARAEPTAGYAVHSFPPPSSGGVDR